MSPRIFALVAAWAVVAVVMVFATIADHERGLGIHPIDLTYPTQGAPK